MVEGAPLLREYTRKGIVGSNPIFSAITPSLISLSFRDFLPDAIAGTIPDRVGRPRITARAAPCCTLVVPGGGAFGAGNFVTHPAMFCDRGSSGRNSPPKGVEVAEA